MTHAEELELLELEHSIRYGTWDEHAAYDSLPEEELPGVRPASEVSDAEITLSVTDIEILEIDDLGPKSGH